MVKNAVEDWSETAGDNTDVGNINIAEDCPAANINNALREIMAQVATWRKSLALQSSLAALDNGSTLVTTGGSGNAYTLTAANTITAYAEGQPFLVRIDRENTGAATLNVDSVGAANWRKYSGGVVVNLDAGDLQEDDIREVTHDGTQFILRENTADKRAIEEHIVTKTYSAGGVIDFTETNASRYSGYRFVLSGVNASGGLEMRFSNNGGSSYISSASAYQHWSEFRDDNDGSGAPNYQEASLSELFLGQGSSTLANGELTVSQPHSGSIATTLNGYSVMGVGSGTRFKYQFSGLRRSASEAHDAFRFLGITGGTISMIGIRDFS